MATSTPADDAYRVDDLTALCKESTPEDAVFTLSRFDGTTMTV
jgi:hypothetical protein